ncbi:MAG: proline--tRNA ligase [Planctomycetota bacterium]
MTTMPTNDAIALSPPHSGEVHRWSQTLIPTTREAPADAETLSHIFLTRAGFIRRVTAGVYTYLPLGWRVLHKVSQIVREEMIRAGAAELLMPALCPTELLEQTGRAEAYGDLLFRFEDRHGRDSYLGPTHEEVITDFMKSAITSYKQLPVNLFQIQSKYRDEFRPRAGLLRGREFLMKDAYSFHLDLEGSGGLNETYDAMHAAYSRIFARCGLDFSAVEAEAGPIGGSASHEFMVNCETGEDTILYCPQSGYAANVEKCEIGERAHDLSVPADGELAECHTPGMPGIEGVAEHLGLTPDRMLKTVVFRTIEDEPRFVLATVRGDHEVNEGKVKDAAGGPVELAPMDAMKSAGLAVGYVSPGSAASIERTVLLIDPDATAAGGWATGADKPDHHVTGWNWSRDFRALAGLIESGRAKVVDVRNAQPGDPSPRAGGATLEARRGIEVGHIFKLGTKYSEAMGFEVMGRDQKKHPIIMGCYGIGVSRTLAACVEMSCDDFGIVWPTALAPYQVLITVLKPDEALLASAGSIASELSARGIDVLIDDRDDRPGPKFKDADLIGVPVRLTVSAKMEEGSQVEFKRRADPGKGEPIARSEVLSRTLAGLGLEPERA